MSIVEVTQIKKMIAIKMRTNLMIIAMVMMMKKKMMMMMSRMMIQKNQVKMMKRQ